MRVMLRVFGAACAMSLLGACSAEYHSIQHEFSATSDKVAIIDGKQRVVAIQQNPKGMRSVCVEQSPDVFSFLSSSASMSVETKKLVAAMAAAVAESGGSLAFRTQVTQAQVNLLYTICQMHAAGGLSDRAVRAELRRFQQTLLGILAIEQMTAPSRQSAAQQILTTSTASVGKDVEVAQAKVDDAKKAVTAAETAAKAAQDEVDKTKPKDAATPASDEHKKALKAKEEKDAAVADAKDKLDIAQKQLQAARLALAASASGAQQSVINVYATPNGSVTDKVADAVVQIVEQSLDRGSLIDSCIELVIEGTAPPPTISTAQAAAEAKAPTPTPDREVKAAVERERNRVDEERRQFTTAAVESCKKAFEKYMDVYEKQHVSYWKVMENDSSRRLETLKSANDLLKAKKITVEQYLKLLNGAGDDPTPPKKPSSVLSKSGFRLDVPLD